MKKYIVREVAAEHAELLSYFDDDGLTEKSGEWNNTLFIVQKGRYGRINGFNLDEYKRIKGTIENLIDGFSDVENGLQHYDGRALTLQKSMAVPGLPFLNWLIDPTVETAISGRMQQGGSFCTDETSRD